MLVNRVDNIKNKLQTLNKNCLAVAKNSCLIIVVSSRQYIEVTLGEE